jgi:hypothetical protein
MESLPPEIKALKRIKGPLDKLMSDKTTPVEIRSNALLMISTTLLHNSMFKYKPLDRANQLSHQTHMISLNFF